MPRLLAKKWTRFHIGATEGHPEGRVVTLEPHPAIEGAFFADISREEADLLHPADVVKEGKHKTHLEANAWKLVESEDEEAARKALEIKKAAEEKAGKEAKA